MQELQGGAPPLVLGIEGVLDEGEVGGALLGALPGHLQRARHLVVALLQVLARPGLPASPLCVPNSFTSKPTNLPPVP